MLVLIRMIFCLAVAVVLLLSLAALSSTAVEPSEKAALLAVDALLLAGAGVVWRLTRERTAAH